MSLDERVRELPLWAAVACAVRAARMVLPHLRRPVDYVSPAEMIEAVEHCERACAEPQAFLDRAPHGYGDHATDLAGAAATEEERLAGEAIAGAAYATAEALSFVSSGRAAARANSLASCARAIRAAGALAPGVTALVERAEARSRRYAWSDSTLVSVGTLEPD